MTWTRSVILILGLLAGAMPQSIYATESPCKHAVWRILEGENQTELIHRQELVHLSEVNKKNPLLANAIDALVRSAKGTAHEQGVWVIETDRGTYMGAIFNSSTTISPDVIAGGKVTIFSRLQERDIVASQKKVLDWVLKNRRADTVIAQHFVRVQPSSSQGMTGADVSLLNYLSSLQNEGDEMSFISVPLQAANHVVFRITQQVGP